MNRAKSKELLPISSVLLALAILSSVGCQSLFGQTTTGDVLVDLFLERYVLKTELQPFLDQQSQLNGQLLLLVQEQSRLTTELQTVRQRQTQLTVQAQTVAAGLVNVQQQIQQNNANISQVVATLVQLQAQANQLRAFLGFNPACQGCAGGECPPECESAIISLIQVEATIETKSIEGLQLVARKESLEAERGQLQIQQETIMIELEFTEAQGELVRTALDQNATQQQAIMQSLVANAAARQPVEAKLAENLLKRQEAWRMLSEQLQIDFHDTVKEVVRIWNDIDSKFPCKPCPPVFNAAMKSAAGEGLIEIPPLGAALLVSQAKDLGWELLRGKIIADPPDPNFGETYRPPRLNLSIPTAYEALPADARVAAKQGIELAGQIFAHLGAVLVSLERYGGAVSVGDLVAIQRQRAAVISYSRILGTLLAAHSDALAILKSSVDTIPTPNDTVTTQMIVNFLAKLQTNGFPQIELTFFMEVGLTESEVGQFRQNLLQLDLSTVQVTRVSELLRAEIESQREMADTLQAVLPPNQLPVCDPGGPYTAECHAPFASAVLDASKSTDPDGGLLSYRWTTDCPNAVFNDSTSVTPVFSVSNVVAPFSCRVMLTVTDLDGTTNTCETSFTVVDTTPPTVHCPPAKLLAAVNCGAAIPDLLPMVSVSDNCAPAHSLTLVQTPAAGTIVGLGPTTVTVTATDQSRNSSFCTTTVTVVDTLPPEITCPADIVVTLDQDQCSKVVTFSVVASDDCPNVTVTCNPTNGSAFPKGKTIVSCTATDTSGNRSTCSFTVTVEDHQPPRINRVTTNPGLLWPPNHQLVPVTVTVSASDNCGLTTSRIISVTSDELANGPDKSVRGADWEVTGDLTLNLRAVRSAKGNGRTYIITVECKDDSGNATTASVSLSVPHDKARK